MTVYEIIKSLNLPTRNQFHYKRLNLYNIDCMEVLRLLPDNYYEVAIVDPPYGISSTRMPMGETSKNESTAKKIDRITRGKGKLKDRFNNNQTIDWDDSPPSEEYFKELFRVSKNQIIWGGNYFNLPPTRGIVFWDKLQPWENFSQFELAWTSYNVPASVIRKSNTGGANKGVRIHPTQKPVELYTFLHSKYLTPMDRILDTGSGSGSQIHSAHTLGFHIDAFEVNVGYFDHSILWLQDKIQQLSLF